MKLTISDVVLLGHAACGILGTLAALWVFVEVLNAREENARRIRWGATAVVICMCAACVLGGYWYLTAYPAEKAIILKGPWPSAHNVFMETKEHLFFVTLILALYLPIAAAEQLDANAIRALRQWKFRPGAKQGIPIELEAIVHIPFRLPENP